MASMLPITCLPALNTFRAPPPGTPEQRRSAKKVLKLDSNERSSKNTLIAAFHRFIRQLIGRGQDDVCFLVASNRSEPAGQLCSVQFPSAESDAIIECVGSVEDVPSDFLLDLQSYNDNSATAPAEDKAWNGCSTKFLARILSSNEGHEIILDVDGHLVPDRALDTLVQLLCFQLTSFEHDAAQMSVLNYPHQKRPVPFPQEPNIGKHTALLHGPFERRAEQFPDRMAIDFLHADQTRAQYTYRQVNSIAERLAAILTTGDQLDKGPVAIVMGPSPELYIAYLAVLKSGRPFCPIPTDAPVGRQMVILEDLACRILITRTHDLDLALFDRNQEANALLENAQIINASEFLNSSTLDSNKGTSDDAETRASYVQEDDLAYILFTSGTTGKPKGVQISHLSASCFIAASSAVVPIASSARARPTRWFQFITTTFDPSLLEIFQTLSGGGTLCCAERQLTLNDVYSVLAQMDVDFMVATPSLATLLDPLQLKGLWTMGEALNAKVIENFSPLNPSASSDWSPSDGPRGLYNAYGPTESSINCTTLSHVSLNTRGSILGAPFASCSLIVVDEQNPLLPVPYGCAGELLIASPQVSSRGYLNRPEETAKVFLPSTPWGRAYRTGDRVRVVWDGSGKAVFDFLGRISSAQVKLSGRRVELGEIDAAVLGIDEVREALTVIYKPPGSEGGGSEKPTTAVSIVDGADWDMVRDKIEKTVQANLMPFMRPHRLFLMQRMPRSAAGKLDRKALTTILSEKINAERAMQSSEQPADDEPQVTLSPHLAEVEEKLLAILGDILQYRPSPTASLVSDAGLDSLRGMQLLSRVRAQRIVEDLSLQDLLSGKSVRRLLLSKDSRQTDTDDKTKALLQDFSKRQLTPASQAAGLAVEGVERVIPATAGQSGAIASLMRSSTGARKTYINHSCYHLKHGHVDIDRLVAAIEDTLIAREAYRTTFVPIDDPVAPFAQCILTPEAARHHHGLCRVVRRSGSHPEEHWLQQAENAISIAGNTMYQVQLVDDDLLIVSLFHGIFDGPSLELLMVDIERQYHGLPKEHRTDIPLAAEMELKLRSKTTDDFWLKQTANFHAETIPALTGLELQPSTELQAETLVAKHTTSLKYADLEVRSRQIGASPLAIWQTAWAMLLSSYSERQAGDVMLGSVVSNRFDPESAVCHGPTFTVLPCRIQVPNDSESTTSVGHLASQVARAGTRALGHAYPSLSLITTAEGKLPYDSLLAFQHFQIEELSEDKHESLWDSISWPAMRHDFGAMLEILPCDQSIPRSQWNADCPMVVKITFKTDCFTDSIASRILVQLSSIVMAILDRPHHTPRRCLGSMQRSLLSAQDIDSRKLEHVFGETLRRSADQSNDTVKVANIGWSVPSFVVTPEPPYHLVPLHGVGELALGSQESALHHLGDPSATGDRSVWSQDLQQRIYLTGKIVRMVDHSIELLGRRNDIAILNGIRVDLAKISATLVDAHDDLAHVETLLMSRSKMPGSAVVSFASIHRDFTGGSLLAQDRHASSVREQILATAHQRLPAYMGPSFLVMLSHMPRTAGNTVDRNMLQSLYDSLDLDRYATELVLSSPQAELESEKRTSIDNRVIEMLSELAGVEATSITDSMSLARLGIHSMAAIRLAWRLKKEVQIGVAVVDLLTCGSVGQLLQIVSSGANRSVRDEEHRRAAHYLDGIEQQLFDRFAKSVESQAASAGSVLSCLRPATTMQEGLVIETLRNNRSYWSHRIFRLPAGVDLGRLRGAWQAVMRHNEILRTSFLIAAEIEPDASSWLRETNLPVTILQAVVESAELRWSTADWDSSSQSIATLADNVAQHERNECSLAASGKLTPPWSITILQDSATHETAMMLHVHHALHDASSMDSMFEDVLKHYHCSGEAVVRRQFGEAMRLGLYPTHEQTERAQLKVQELYAPLVEHFGTMTSTKCPDLTGSRQPQQRRILRTRASISPYDDTKLWGAFYASMRKFELKSLAHMIFAALGCVLAEYLESKYVVIGETLDQRVHDANLQSVIGPLIVTVPVAVRMDLSTSELLSSARQTKNTVMQDLYHMQPGTLRKTLGISSDRPLYPALVVFHPRMDHEQANDEPEQSVVRKFFDEMDDVVGLSVEHSLALNIFEGHPGEGFQFELSGDSGVISMPQLELMWNQVKSQLAAMLAHPDIPLAKLNSVLPRSLLSVTDATYEAMNNIRKHARKPEWSGIASPTINPVAWVEYHARHHPRWVAAEQLCDSHEPYTVRRWTYAHLLSKVSHILEALAKRGIRRGTVVAVHLSRTLESFATIIALFRGEYIYLPLDEELPPKRTVTLAVDAGATVFITTQDLLTELEADLGASPLGNVDVVLLDEMLSSSNLPSVPSVLPKYKSTRRSTDNGYILFTSGSTGKPKGVRVTNYNLCNFIESLGKRILDHSPQTARLGGIGKYLNLASRSFDPHLTHMFMAWRFGLAATIGPRMMMLSNLEKVIQDNSITHFGTVPSLLQQAQLSPDRVPSVVLVTVGGEKVSNDVLDTWAGASREAISTPLMLNAYGPTECTIGCSSNVVNCSSNARNIGRVHDSAMAIVFAEEDSRHGGEQIIAKRGQPGELCIAGDMVSLGYLDRPEAQAAAFATTELLTSGDDGTPVRFYKTGDLVRMMADGSLEFLGRSDQQVKVNGQRLELGEVEQFLQKTAEAMKLKLEFAAAVIDHPELPRPRLFAFAAGVCNWVDISNSAGDHELTMTSGPQNISSELSETCSKSLPAFMLPELIWVNHIPHLRASGKVDTKRLNALVRGTPLSQLHCDEDTGTVGHRHDLLTEDEEVVRQAIEHTLGSKIKDPIASRSIYELGIDSMSAISLSAYLKQLGFQLSTADVLSHATIRRLAQQGRVSAPADDSALLDMAAQRIETFQKDHQLDLVSSFENAGVEVEQVLPTMPLQSALLARSMAQLQDDEEDVPTRMKYVTQLRYSLPSSTDLRLFVAAVKRVLQEEQMLRTCFRQVGSGQMAQIVLSRSPEDSSVSVVNTSWATWSQTGSLDLVARQLVEDIGNIPPVRVHVFNGSPADVLLSMHHALFDGDAIRQIRERIQEHYQGTVQFRTRPYAIEQLLVRLEAVNTDAAKMFWQQALRNAIPCLVHGHLDNAEERTTDSPCRSMRRLSFSLEHLQGAAQNCSISLNALFQTVFAALLSELLPSRSDVIFGNVVSLRPMLASTIRDIDRVVAPCLNTLPQRVELSKAGQGQGSLLSLARKIRENFSESIQHAFVPLDQILKWSGSSEALFDAVISINMHQEETAQGDASASPGFMTLAETMSATNVPFAADINVHHRTSSPGYVEVEISSSTRGVQVPKLASRFEEFCSIFVKRPEIQVFDLLPLLPKTHISVSSTGTEESLASDPTPWSATETVIRDAVCQLLAVSADKLDKRTSFYRLGLDSILVLRLVKLLHDRLNVKLSPLAVLRARCVEGVAGILQQRGAPSTSPTQGSHPEQCDYAKDLQRLASRVDVDAGTSRCYFATPMQQGMLSAGLAYAEHADGRAKPYVYRHTFEMKDRFSFNLAAFQDAWKQTVGRVEILRTTFHFTEDDNQPWIGVVHPFADVFAGIQIAESIEKAVRAQVNIDVSSCLVCCTLVTPAEPTEPIRVVFTMHHAIYDGASLSLLWRTLAKNYQAQTDGGDGFKASLVPFSYAAKRIAIQQAAAVDYWCRQLDGYSYEPISKATIHDADDTNARSVRYRAVANVSREQVEELKRRCRDLGVTIHAALMVAWSKVLSSDVLEQSDVVFGQVLDGRLLPFDDGGQSVPADSVVGPLLNTVAVRMVLSPTYSNREILLRAQKLSENAQQHQMASLRVVQNSWRSKTPHALPSDLFQSLLLFNGDDTGVTADLHSGIWKPSRLTTEHGKDVFVEYPLVCNVSASHEGLQLQVSTASSHFNTSFADRLASNVKITLLEQLASLDHPSVSPSLPSQKCSPSNSEAAGDEYQGADDNELYQEHAHLCALVLDAFRAIWTGGNMTTVVDARTNLFRVGLDSILAIRLSSRLSRSAAPLTVAQIMQGKTIAAMIHELRASSTREQKQQKSRGNNQERQLAELITTRERVEAIGKFGWTETDVESVLPCLASQEFLIELWIFAGHRFFEAPWIYKLKFEQPTANVRNAWDELRRHHAILRTSFAAVRDEAQSGWKAVQVTLKPHCINALRDSTFTLVQSDESNELDALVVSHLQQSNNQPSNLLSPPARLTLLRTADGASAMVMRLHHAMYDAWSIRRVLRDFDALIAGDGEISSPTDLSEALLAVHSQRQPEEEQTFWSQALDGAQKTILRGDPGDTTTSGQLGPQHLVRMPSIVSAAAVRNLENLSRGQASASLSPAILYAFAQTLAEYTGVDSPTFGFYHASRSLGPLDLTQLAAPTTTLTPMSVVLGEDAHGASMAIAGIQSIQDHLSKFGQFSQASLHDILRSIGQAEPLFNSHINLLYRGNSSLEGNGSTSEPQRMATLEKLTPSYNTYFTDSIPLEQCAPPVRDLDTSYLAPQRLNLDVAIDRDDGGISLGLRCERSLFGIEEIHTFARRFVGKLLALEKLLSSVG